MSDLMTSLFEEFRERTDRYYAIDVDTFADIMRSLLLSIEKGLSDGDLTEEQYQKLISHHNLVVDIHDLMQKGDEEGQPMKDYIAKIRQKEKAEYGKTSIDIARGLIDQFTAKTGIPPEIIYLGWIELLTIADEYRKGFIDQDSVVLGEKDKAVEVLGMKVIEVSGAHLGLGISL